MNQSVKDSVSHGMVIYIYSCQLLTGNWLVTMVNLLLKRSSSISSKSRWQVGSPIKGPVKRKNSSLSEKIHLFFRLSSHFRTSTASLHCHLFFASVISFLSVPGQHFTSDSRWLYNLLIIKEI
jgi:hypothetical protein